MLDYVRMSLLSYLLTYSTTYLLDYSSNYQLTYFLYTNYHHLDPVPPWPRGAMEILVNISPNIWLWVYRVRTCRQVYSLAYALNTLSVT